MWFEYIFTRPIKTIMILWSCTCFCVVSKWIKVHHHEFKVQRFFAALEVKFKLVLNTNDSFVTPSTAVISVTPRSCTDIMYVLSALDKSIHQMSKCKQQKLLSEYLRGALFCITHKPFMVCFWIYMWKNIKTKCFLSTRVSAPWREGLLALYCNVGNASIRLAFITAHIRA